MQTLACADFADYVSHPFPVTAGGGQLHLVLEQAVERAPIAPNFRVPFSLIFLGPASAPLPQGTYEFDHPQLGSLPIFIVPIAASPGGVTYQAIFS